MGSHWSIQLARAFFVVGMCNSLCTSIAAQTCIALPDDAVAWWTFDEVGGSISHDIVGNRNGTQLNGPSPVAGRVGGALQFDGVDDYVCVSDDDAWAFGESEFTIEFWAYFDAPPHSDPSQPGDVFISNDEGPGDVSKWFFAQSSSVLAFHTNSPSTGGVFSPFIGFTPRTQQWYHFATTRSGTQYRVFIDGMLTATGSNAAVVANPASNLTLGRAMEFWGGFLQGRLDEMTIYGRALSEAEVQAIFEAGEMGKCRNLQMAPISSFCTGDGCAAPCPCSNAGAAGRGCRNSKPGSTGAQLSAVDPLGKPNPSVSVTANELGLKSAGMLAGSYCIFFQGTLMANGGVGQASPAFDGLECIGGPIVRLGRITTMGGSNTLAGVAGVAGLAATAQTLHYQTAYRNAVNYCTPATLNTSNALRITWQP